MRKLFIAGLLPNSETSEPELLSRLKLVATFHIRIIIILTYEIIWVDPVIAVGYDYFIDHGPMVTRIELPEGIGDNKYNLWLFNPELNEFTDSGVELVGGELYNLDT